MKRLAAATTATLALTFLGAAPASAQRLTVSDPAGDAADGLDITSARVDNREHAVVARVGFKKLRRGDLIVSVDRRRGEGVRLVSEYRPRGATRNYIVTGAFTDASGGELTECSGFSVRWDTKASTAVLRMPARCLADGEYGAVRFAVLTEAPEGADADFAPETRRGDLGSSGWIRRG